MDADYVEAGYQPESVRPSGGGRRYGSAGHVVILVAIVRECRDAEFAIPADFKDLPLEIG